MNRQCGAELHRRLDGPETVRCTRQAGHAEERHAGWLADERLVIWREDDKNAPWFQATVRYV